MRTMLTAMALIGASALAVPAIAQTATPSAVTEVRTVADLAAICDPPANSPLRLEAIAYCQGYVTAAGQYHTALHPAGGRRPPLFCLPDPAPTVAQTGLGFAAWARQNPQHAAEPALDGLFRWAQATYPCPTPARPARGAAR
ncbi:Rap1a/Tai family immunity protein [Roseomonas sp. KE0001]|uniref:Rap1a/Tai family immunity protein n=1 Tax=unclassified Roseomonas TaxID=2617492 RepID=UPI0018E014B0|nr:Rap1a/Tai family immunity protein [Roseomonas sp. KE0001]